MSVKPQQILLFVTDCFFVIGNASDLAPWANSTDVVRVLGVFFVVFRVGTCVCQKVFIAIVSAVGERHLVHSVQGSVSEVWRDSGGGGV